MKVVAVFVLAVLVANGAREPRLETIENKIKRFARHDFKMLGESKPEAGGESARPLSLWVAEESIDGMAIALLDGSPAVCPAPVEPDAHVYHLFVIQASRRDELADHLQEQGISTGVHYPIPIHLQPAYGALGSQGAFPVTEKSAKRILSLPMYPGITSAAVEKTANAVRSFYDG